MNITPRGVRARELFLAGYNCSQAVAGAYYDKIGLDFETVMRLAEPFGGGMGRLREVCGTFSGALFVIGQLYGGSQPKSPTKALVYSYTQELAARLRELRGTIICRELLGFAQGHETDPAHPSERNAEFYRKRPCPEIAAETASLLEELLEKWESET